MLIENNSLVFFNNKLELLGKIFTKDFKPLFLFSEYESENNIKFISEKLDIFLNIMNFNNLYLFNPTFKVLKLLSGLSKTDKKIYVIFFEVNQDFCLIK